MGANTGLFRSVVFSVGTKPKKHDTKKERHGRSIVLYHIDSTAVAELSHTIRTAEIRLSTLSYCAIKPRSLADTTPAKYKGCVLGGEMATDDARPPHRVDTMRQ